MIGIKLKPTLQQSPKLTANNHNTSISSHVIALSLIQTLNREKNIDLTNQESF